MEGIFRIGIFQALQKLTDIFQNLFPLIGMVSMIAAIWIYYLYLSENHHDRTVGTWNAIRKVLQFRTLLTGVLVKVLYLALAIAMLISGLISMFTVAFFPSLIALIILEILLRLICEASTILFGIYDQLCELNKKHDLVLDAPEWEDVPHPDEKDNLPSFLRNSEKNIEKSSEKKSEKNIEQNSEKNAENNSKKNPGKNSG